MCNNKIFKYYIMKYKYGGRQPDEDGNEEEGMRTPPRERELQPPLLQRQVRRLRGQFLEPEPPARILPLPLQLEMPGINSPRINQQNIPTQEEIPIPIPRLTVPQPQILEISENSPGTPGTMSIDSETITQAPISQMEDNRGGKKRKFTKTKRNYAKKRKSKTKSKSKSKSKTKRRHRIKTKGK